jgi:molybdopterin converting factor small subunit
MARVFFTKNLQRHVSAPEAEAAGDTVAAVLAAVFEDNPRVRGYVLDDQGALRKHMAVFVDGAQIRDRQTLSDPVSDGSEIYVMHALSGG